MLLHSIPYCYLLNMQPVANVVSIVALPAYLSRIILVGLMVLLIFICYAYLDSISLLPYVVGNRTAMRVIGSQIGVVRLLPQ